MSLRDISKIILLNLLITNIGHSQLYQRSIDNPIISNGTTNYVNPFSGGYNNIEHQFVDIDNDGDEDLFYLNSDGTFGFLVNSGNPQSPQFKFLTDTIPGLEFLDWFFFIDADDDSDKDYFTSNGEYIAYKSNIGSSETPIFTLALDTLKDNLGSYIPTETGSNPTFADIDSDGDYDLFLGNTAGTITFYENIGTSQNFQFKFITNQWQNIVIIGTVLMDDPLHGASSLEFVDIDSDNDLDLLWGDFFSNSLYLLTNSGTATTPNIQLASNVFPINEDSVNTSGFNMPRTVDIDADGDLDLFVSVLYDPSVPQSLMFYENQGNQFVSDYKKITDDYLNTLDVGNNSHPFLIDIDSDGDKDLFIGSLKNPLGTIYYFNNSGTSQSPKFDLITDNFAGISSDLSVTPVFGDIDADDDFDLFVGRFDGKISYYKNVGDKFNPSFLFQGFVSDVLATAIDIGSSSVPLLFDNDDDGDLDLTIGAFNGRLVFYRNIGNAANPMFDLDATYFIGIDIGDNSTPFFTDYDSDGDHDLFCGNRDGSILYFRNDSNNIFPIWNQHSNYITQLNLGGYSAPFFIDIENDSDIDLMFGNIKGGLYLYNNLTISEVNEQDYKLIDFEVIEAYPNPFNPVTNLRFVLSEPGNISLKVFNNLGEEVKEIFSGYKNSGVHQYVFDGSQLSSGVYFVKFQTTFSVYSIKLALIK